MKISESLGLGHPLIRAVIGYSSLLALLLAGAGWYLYGQIVAQSIICGAFLINMSFLLLGKDIRQLLYKVGEAGERATAVSRIEKIRFALKYFARMVVLGLIVLLLTTRVPIHMVGFAIGLGTVVLSIVFIALVRKNILYSE